LEKGGNKKKEMLPDSLSKRGGRTKDSKGRTAADFPASYSKKSRRGVALWGEEILSSGLHLRWQGETHKRRSKARGASSPFGEKETTLGKGKGSGETARKQKSVLRWRGRSSETNRLEKRRLSGRLQKTSKKQKGPEIGRVLSFPGGKKEEIKSAVESSISVQRTGGEMTPQAKETQH